MKDPNLTALDLKVEDISAGGLKFAAERRGRDSLAAVVGGLFHPVLTTRRYSRRRASQFQKTMDEMAAAAEKLNDPANGIYRFTGRGLRNANMTLWTNFFLNYGGEIPAMPRATS